MSEHTLNVVGAGAVIGRGGADCAERGEEAMMSKKRAEGVVERTLGLWMQKGWLVDEQHGFRRLYEEAIGSVPDDLEEDMEELTEAVWRVADRLTESKK